MRSMNVLRSRWGAIATFVVVAVVATTTSVGGANVAAGGCIATRSGDSVLLEFDALTERSFLRRDGNWLATLDAGTSSYVDGRAPQDASYVIRSRPDDVVVDVSCTEAVDEGPGDGGPVEAEPACTATRIGDTVTLEFDVGAERPIIRRNGSWLTGLPEDSVLYLDTGAPDGATYVVRTRPGGVLTDLACTSAVEDPVDPVDPVGPFCTATVGEDFVSFEFGGLIERSFLRRDGNWLATLDAGTLSFVDDDPRADATYLVRSRPAGLLIEIPCNPVGDPVDPVVPVGPFCTAAVGGGSVTLEFDVGDQRPIIRRNGFWLATAAVGSTSFTDFVAPNGATYVVRTRPGGVSTDIACTPAIDDPVDPVDPMAVANRVIHISIDGLRSDHVTSELTPRLSMMMSDGASTLNARTDPAETSCLLYTSPSPRDS